MPIIARLLGKGLLSVNAAHAARVAGAGNLRPSDILSGRARWLATAGALGDEPDEADQTVPVSSTAIRSIGWRNDGIIVVEFNERGTYTYDGTYEMFLAFVAAPSKGQFFNQNFK